MSEDSDTRRQHYVPQSYLKGFENSSGNICCFDKVEKKSFQTNTRNIGQENWFYDDEGEQETEEKLSELEGQFKPILEQILGKENIDCLSQRQKETLADFLANQAVRTRERREHMKQTLKGLKEELEGENLQGAMEAFYKTLENEEIREDRSRDLQKEMLQNHIDEIKELLLQHDWILLENNSDIPFWTSDNPVVMFNPLNQPNRGNLGFASKGIQIYFPLSPKFCLTVVDGSAYPTGGQEIPSKYTHEIPDSIKNHNHMQLKWSTRQVYSKEEDFSLAERALQDEPELGDLDRVRIKQPDYQQDYYEKMLQNWKHYIRWWRTRR